MRETVYQVGLVYVAVTSDANISETANNKGSVPHLKRLSEL